MCSFFFEEWNCLRTGKRQKRRINNLNFLRHFLKLDKSNWRVASPEIVCFHCIWYSSIRFFKLSGVWEGVWDDNYFSFCIWPSFSFTKMNSSKWNFESEQEKFIGGTWLKFFFFQLLKWNDEMQPLHWMMLLVISCLTYILPVSYFWGYSLL